MSKPGDLRRDTAGILNPVCGQGRRSTSMKHERKPHVKWTAPKFIEVLCGMEINSYEPADGEEPAPVLF